MLFVGERDGRDGVAVADRTNPVGTEGSRELVPYDFTWLNFEGLVGNPQLGAVDVHFNREGDWRRRRVRQAKLSVFVAGE